MYIVQTVTHAMCLCFTSSGKNQPTKKIPHIFQKLFMLMLSWFHWVLNAFNINVIFTAICFIFQLHPKLMRKHPLRQYTLLWETGNLLMSHVPFLDTQCRQWSWEMKMVPRLHKETAQYPIPSVIQPKMTLEHLTVLQRAQMARHNIWLSYEKQVHVYV